MYICRKIGLNLLFYIILNILKQYKHLLTYCFNMKTEREILNDMSELMNALAYMLTDCRNKALQLKEDIKNLDNNYFEVKDVEFFISFFNEENFLIYDEEIANQMKEHIRQKNELISKLQTEDFLKHESNGGQHKWVKDTIDMGPESSKNICYCELCEITKK